VRIILANGEAILDCCVKMTKGCKSFKYVVFCRDEPRHIYFANQLNMEFNIEALVVQRAVPVYRQLIGHRELKRRINEFYKYLRTIYKRKVFKERRFFGEQSWRFHYNKRIVDILDINNIRVEKVVEEIFPDLILTFGCGILKKDTFFEKSTNGIINLHSGIVPDYRGVDNVYWCLHNNEPSQIGATIHYIARSIDTGDILAQVYPSINTSDDELSLFNKTIQSGIDSFKKVISDFERNGKKLVGTKQPCLGHLYQEKDRTVLTDIKVKRFLINGGLKKVLRQEKEEILYETKDFSTQ